jgi:hypothetical protein
MSQRPCVLIERNIFFKLQKVQTLNNHIITPDIFILKMTRALWGQNTFTLNDSRPLAPKYSEYFTGSAPPILYS